MACTVHEFSSHDHMYMHMYMYMLHFYTYTYTLHVMEIHVMYHVPSGCTIQLYQERTACDRDCEKEAPIRV